MKLETGRPADCTGRLEKEIRVYDLLDSLGIAYDRIDHPATATMEDCLEIDRLLGAATCKNLLLCNRQKTAYYLLLIPGDKRFRTTDLSHQIGSSRLSFAPGEDMEALLDITPGSLTVLGLMNDRDRRVKLLIDRDVLREPLFGCHPCINTTTLRLKTADVMEILLPALGREPEFVTLPDCK